MKFLSPILFLFLFGISHAQVFTLPDAQFKNFLQSNYPSVLDSNGNLIIANAGAIINQLDCSNRNISNIDGIQYFTGINALNCSRNNLTTIPNLSAITGLRHVFVEENQLTNLSFLESNDIITIHAENNLISDLSGIDGNATLKNLHVANNKIVNTVFLSSLPALEILNISFNQISVLSNLASSSNLQVLICNNNKLTSLPDFSNNISLNTVKCQSNSLTSLPQFHVLPYNLKSIDCSYNKLTSLSDFTNFTSLDTIICSHNLLETFIAYTGLSALKYLDLSYNKLTELPDLSLFNSLDTLYVSHNLLSKPYNLLNWTSLKFIDVSYNKLTDINITYNTPLHHIVDHNYLTFESLKELQAAPGIKVMFPQNSIPALDFIQLKENEVYSLNLNIDNAVPENTYDWYLDGNYWKTTSTSSIDVENINSELRCLVRNPAFPNDTIASEIIKVYTNACANKDCDEFVLSPNGDGIGDNYFMNYSGKIEIMDREGKIVKTSNEPFFWNGDEKATGYFLVFVDGKKVAAITLIR